MTVEKTYKHIDFDKQMIIGFQTTKLNEDDTGRCKRFYLGKSTHSKSYVLINAEKVMNIHYEPLKKAPIKLNNFASQLIDKKFYMKDITWGIAKILPEIYPSVHRFKVVDSSETNINKLKQQIIDLNSNKGHETKYILIATGTNIQYIQFEELLCDTPENARHRRILKKQNVWRSYRYLYPSVKSTIPRFEELGSHPTGYDLADITIEPPSGIPKPILGGVFNPKSNYIRIINHNHVIQDELYHAWNYDRKLA